MEMARAIYGIEMLLDEQGSHSEKEAWNTIRKALAEALKTPPNTQKPCASQIADSIDAACFPVGGGFIPPKESWLREWCRQLRAGA